MRTFDSLDQWLSQVSPAPVTKISAECLFVDCRNHDQVDQLLKTAAWLKRTDIKLIFPTVQGVYLGRVETAKLKDTRFSEFSAALCDTHAQILEESRIEAEGDCLAFYCPSKEHAIALDEGRWDLVAAIEALELPYTAIAIYCPRDEGYALFFKCTTEEARMEERLKRRELRDLFREFDQMPRRYQTNKPVSLRPLPQPVRQVAPLTRKQVIERLGEALGNDWKPMNDLKAGAALLTEALGPGWSVSELRQLTRNGTLQQGQHWFKRGGRYAVDVVAIAEWYFAQQE